MSSRFYSIHSGFLDRLARVCTCGFDLLIGTEWATSILPLEEAAHCHSFHFTEVDLRGRGFRGGH